MKKRWRQKIFDYLMSGLLAVLSPRKFLRRKKKQDEEKKHRDMFELWKMDRVAFTERYRSLTTKERGNFWRWLHRTGSDGSLSVNARAEINRLITELSERVIASRKDRFR